ncbi:HS12B-like protein, partial [Mya arenaria]
MGTPVSTPKKQNGYAFSFAHSPLEIKANYWPDGSIKTPTVILLDPDGRFHSFGKEAMDKYSSLLHTKEHKQWFYFDRIKMVLYEKGTPLNLDVTIEDKEGKPMKAIDIFTMAIEYFVHQLVATVTDKNRLDGLNFTPSKDIHWMVTVPAIWNDKSKLFMRNAAVKGHMAPTFSTVTEGGTVDITVHELNEDNSLTELYPPTGGDFGGTDVDNRFLQLLNDIFGISLMQKFKSDCLEEFIEMMSEFEIAKRRFNGTGKLIMKFPASLIEMYEFESINTCEHALEAASLNESIEIKFGRIYINANVVKKMFQYSVNEISNAIRNTLNKVENIQKVVLAGGFSESQHLQLVLTETYGFKLLEVSSEPSGAVLKGAVLFGHTPGCIVARVCPRTYGVARMVKFRPEKPYSNPPDKKITIDGKDYCDGIFDIHIQKGTKVAVTERSDIKEHVYFRPSLFVSNIIVEVFASDSLDPKYVDEPDCEKIGEAVIEMDPMVKMRSKIMVKLVFGGTELEL